MSLSRRRFLSQSAAVTTAFSGLLKFTAGTAHSAGTAASKYGELVADPLRIFDLPAGFSYKIIGRAGDYMDDGLRMPGRTDGMGAFPAPDGKTVLVRNHELESHKTYQGPFGLQNELLEKIDPGLIYDAGQKIAPHIGGTTTVVYDTKTKTVERQFLSLVGTCRNCAGGPTPWGTWITCEETVERIAGSDPGDTDNKNEKDHGYNFEVPATGEPALTKPVPLTAMGRFYHEAIAVDPATGIVYQTEDRHDALFYRFVPTEKGNLQAGGKLQAMAVDGPPPARPDRGFDTRNWPDSKDTFAPLTPAPVRWIDIDDIDNPGDDLRKRGFALGAARLARSEGIWHGEGEFYIACTNGGKKQYGQILRYRPSPAEGTPAETTNPGTLEIFVEPNDKTLLQGADNLTVAPWGDVIVVEDGPKDARIHGISPDGGIYKIGRNEYNSSELAGVCVSPDGTTLFVNIYDPGITLAITGPWA
ncbi:MAG: DUF839 domain-containing protein [Verrucomicrobiales bacterium]|nr:DUF839 domain-containing protein [Verrucomicrobiales bacterium]